MCCLNGGSEEISLEVSFLSYTLGVSEILTSALFPQLTDFPYPVKQTVKTFAMHRSVYLKICSRNYLFSGLAMVICCYVVLTPSNKHYPTLHELCPEMLF